MEFPSKWGATGRDIPDITGGITIMPGGNGDFERRKLLARLVSMLYGLVSGAQRKLESKDETEHAVQQLVLANAALIAVETETFLFLVDAGLEGPAEIHLRSMAEMTIRIAICRKHRDFALKLYRSWKASWEDIVENTLKIPIVRLSDEQEEREQNMRRLENSAEFKRAREAIVSEFHLPDNGELSMYSKRSHGDISALVKACHGLASRGTDIRSALAKESPIGVTVNIRLSRAIGIALLANAHIEDEFKFESAAMASLNECFDLYAAIQEREEQEMAALRRPKSKVIR